MDWTLLGIAPTTDKNAITAAYRAQLARTNPEDDPEGFKALRAAYEQALQLAEQAEQPAAQDDSPLGLWKGKLRALYDDFPARIDPARWQELLQDPVCTALDTRPLAEEALLQFLMQEFYIPQSVWQVLDGAFSWLERRGELYESYPRDFVDYAVLNGIRFSENLPYALFLPGESAADCDDYRRIYYRANQAPTEELPALLQQLDELGEAHPYGEVLRVRLWLAEGERERALGLCRRLAQDYPQDAKLQLEWAAQCIQAENWTEAEEYARRAMTLRPNAAQPKQMVAECLAAQGKYEDAKELIFRLMDEAGGDQKRIYELRLMVQQWNEQLMEALRAQLEETPDDDEVKSKLAWCCLQNDKAAEALALCRTISERYADRYDYHNLFAKCAYAADDYETALHHLREAEQLIRVMQPDGTDKTAQRIDTLPEKLQMQGSCHLLLGRRAEALAVYEQALAIAPKSPEVLTHMGRLLCQLGHIERAAQIFEQLTAVMPSSYHGFFLLSQTLFDLRRDRDAFDAINRALELEGGDLGVYVLKMRILLRNGVWDAVRETIDFLHQHGVTDDINVLWCQAQLTEYADKDNTQALALYRQIAQRVEGGERLEDASTLYFRLLVLEAAQLDAREKADRQKMLSIAEKGLAWKEDDLPLLDYKAWLLKRDGQRDAALELYHRLEQFQPHPLSVEQELAELYYEDLDTDAHKARHYYQLLLQNEETAARHFYLGNCCKYLGDYAAAEQHFLRAQELNTDGIDGFNGMSYLYDTTGKYEASLEQINEVIRRVKEWEGDQSRFFYHKVRILRRLNRPLEAMSTIDELTAAYGNDDVYREKFDIACQFGLWEEAEAILAAWRKADRKSAALAAAYIDLDLFTMKLDAVRKALGKAKNLRKSDAQRLQLSLAELDGDEATQMDIWQQKAQGKNEQTHELMNMAQVQWWNGHYDQARAYAQTALEQLEKIIPKNRKWEALYRGRRALVLGILGRLDEAREELARVRALPLCESCNYCACKDADIFEANFEEICGNWEKAMALHRAGAQRWPDDIDFSSGMRRMMRKGL